MQMKALSFSRFGSPETVMTYQDVALPKPKAGEVRIRMVLAPIHNHHLWYVRGKYGIRPALPAISGDEALGVIDAVGAGVKGLHKGQKVVACKMWGAWAAYFIANSADVVPAPDGVPDEMAAQLLSMPLSTMMLLAQTGAKKGQWIIQNAANGAVGKLLALLAKERHIFVVSLVRSKQAKAEMQKAGIGRIVCTDEADWQNQVLRLTGGRKAVAGIDSLGGAASGEMLSLLKKGGSLISFGAQTHQKLEIEPADLIFFGKKVRGFWATKAAKDLSLMSELRIFFNILKALLAGRLNLHKDGGFHLKRLAKVLALKRLVEMIKAGKIALPVAGIYPLSEYEAALEASEKQGRKGKVLFCPK